MNLRVAWHVDGWRGWKLLDVDVEPGDCTTRAMSAEARASRHARTVPLEQPTGRLWVKFYPAPGWRRARRAVAMGDALHAAGFDVPRVVVALRRGREGLVVTRDVEGEPLAAAFASPRTRDTAARRRLLRELGEQVAALHTARFVPGDLVPSNVFVRDDHFIWLDHDRTYRSRWRVWWGGRRNLVQLGRFVLPGVTLADRARVLRAYAAARGLRRPAVRRLARWLVARITARRCAIDAIAPDVAAHAGFRALMQSGGAFDPGPGAAR